MARLGLSFHDLKDQSTLKSLMSLVWLICAGVTPMRSKTGEGGMFNSFGEILPAVSVPACEKEIVLRRRKAIQVERLYRMWNDFNSCHAHWANSPKNRAKMKLAISVFNTSLGEIERS